MTQVFSDSLRVSEGDLAVITITCQTGPYLKDCGQPEYFDEKHDIRILMPCVNLWTLGATTEQTFEIISPATGTFKFYIPVLLSDHVYKGHFMVIQGPRGR